jgi:phosphate transport system ATP-binding protein
MWRFGPRIHGCAAVEYGSTVQHYLQKVGLLDELKDRLNESAARLSIGQQQRLCLARGWRYSPKSFWGTNPHRPWIRSRRCGSKAALQELKQNFTVVL